MNFRSVLCATSSVYVDVCHVLDGRRGRWLLLDLGFIEWKMNLLKFHVGVVFEQGHKSTCVVTSTDIHVPL